MKGVLGVKLSSVLVATLLLLLAAKGKLFLFGPGPFAMVAALVVVSIVYLVINRLIDLSPLP